MKVLVSKEKITEYIPQQHPIVMIDTIIHFDELSITTTLTVRPDNIFFSDGELKEPGIIENIAQTAAARAGYEIKQKGADPMVGFIGAIKDLKINYHPQEGETITTTIKIRMEVMGVTLIDGNSECNGKPVASCEMKIFLQKPDQHA